MTSFDEVFTVFKEFLPLITAGGAFVSAAGLVPRIGLGRAFWIALRSRFAFKPVPESLRSAEIQLLKFSLAEKDFGQSYLVVTGETGVGKTCLISTATSKTPGVITVEAPPGLKQEDVVKMTLKSLTNMPFNFIPPFSSAKRVVFWHRILTFGRSPIVVINAAERSIGQEYAGLTGAVRALTDKYKLRVVVDGSPNSLEEKLFRTHRQQVFDIKPMTREMIWKISQLQELFTYSKEAGLDDALFAVLGGNPSRYKELWNNAKAALKTGEDARLVIGAHLCAEIYAAILIVKDAKSTKDMKEIINLFDKHRLWIRSDMLVDKDLNRPTPDKIFREVERNGVFVLIPASNAIGIVLRHGLTDEPSLNQLEELIKHKL